MKALHAILALLLAATLWVFALALIGALYRPDLDIPAGVLGAHIDVQTLRIRVLQRNERERHEPRARTDVLLIHGSPGSIEDWTPLLGPLASSLRVTAYDRPGHGYSADWGQHSLPANAQLAQSVIERLKLQDVLVVGQGYGGAIALALALRDPAQVRAYVTIDTAAYTPASHPEPLFRLLAIPLIGLGSASLLSPLLATGRIHSSLTQPTGAGALPEDFVALRSRMSATPKVAHAVATEALGAAAELAAQSARYGAIQSPVWALTRRGDPAAGSSAARLGRDVPHARVVLLDDSEAAAGHALPPRADLLEIVQAIRALAQIEVAH